MKLRAFLCLVLAGLALSLSGQAARAAVTVGSTAPNFTVRNHATGQPLRLYDYAGKIVLLDFWAYWCGPCQSAAADIEPNVVDYYRQTGGNPNGVPVQVISISVDLSDLAAENNYIQTFGLELVGDDNSGTFGVYGNGYIPYLLVVNGTTNSTTHPSWRVLYSQAGYGAGSTVPTMKNLINSIQTAPPTLALTAPAAGSSVPPGDITLTATINSQGKIIKKVEFYNGPTLLGFRTNQTHTTTTTTYSLPWTGVTAGQKAVSVRALYGTASWANGATVNFTVANEPITATLRREGSDWVLRWNGGTGLYRVQISQDLSSPDNWLYVTEASSAMSLVITPIEGAAFYRVVRAP